MTDILDPPTVSEIDLAAQRWEVETSVPVAITGETAPGDADFVIASYATQSSGSEALDRLAHLGAMTQLRLSFAEDSDLNWRRHLGDEFGLREITSILASSAEGHAYLLTGRQVEGGPEGAQLLRGMLAEFVEAGTGIGRIAQREIIEGILEQFPVPIFGSPPTDFSTITQLMQRSPFLAAVGYGVWSESPALVVVSAGTGLVVWFARPAANVFRRSIAERLARKLGTDYRPEDEQ